jgi:hypothetical protein
MLWAVVLSRCTDTSDTSGSWTDHKKYPWRNALEKKVCAHTCVCVCVCVHWLWAPYPGEGWCWQSWGAAPRRTWTGSATRWAPGPWWPLLLPGVRQRDEDLWGSWGLRVTNVRRYCKAFQWPLVRRARYKCSPLTVFQIQYNGPHTSTLS